jgi:hypothetical protein
MRALAAAAAEMPETRSGLATVNRLGESAASLVQAAATLP